MRFNTNVKQLLVLAAIPVGMAISAASNAQTTLFNNLSGAINNTAPPSAYSPKYVAASFSTDAASYNTVDVTMAMTLAGSGTFNGTVNVALYSDNSNAPGTFITALGTVSESTLPIFNSTDTIDFGAASANLAANTRYWVYLTGGTQNGGSLALTHALSGIGSTGQSIYLGSTYESDTSYTAIMKVVASKSATATPEPGAEALLSGVVFTLLGSAFSRRRK